MSAAQLFLPTTWKTIGYAMLGEEEEKAAEKMREIVVFSGSDLEALHNCGVV